MINRIARRFRNSRPATEAEAMRFCRVGLRYIDSGTFRNVYQVDDLPLVAKFPVAISDNDEVDGKAHSQTEFSVIKRLRRCRKQFASLQQYLPKVYYMEPKTGVMLMHKYEPIIGKRKLVNKVDCIGQEFGLAFNLEDWDFHQWNFGVDADNDRIVLLDFGCLS